MYIYIDPCSNFVCRYILFIIVFAIIRVHLRCILLSCYSMLYFGMQVYSIYDSLCYHQSIIIIHNNLCSNFVCRYILFIIVFAVIEGDVHFKFYLYQSLFSMACMFILLKLVFAIIRVHFHCILYFIIILALLFMQVYSF